MFPCPTFLCWKDFASFLTSHSSIQQFCAQEVGTWQRVDPELLPHLCRKNLAECSGWSHDYGSRPFADHGTLVLPGCSGRGCCGDFFLILPCCVGWVCMGWVWTVWGDGGVLGSIRGSNLGASVCKELRCYWSVWKMAGESILWMFKGE